MYNEEIKTHNFDKAKNKIKKFSGDLPQTLNFNRFEEEGRFWELGGHKVTGEEVNKFLVEVQGEFINNNNTIKGIIKEFEEVYDAFEALDEDYIQYILLNLKAVQKVSQDAKTLSTKVESAQKDINITIEALQETVKRFKIFNDSVSKNILKIDAKVNTLNSRVNELMPQPESSTTSQIDLENIDEFADVIGEKNNETNLHERLSSIEERYTLEIKENAKRMKIAYFIASVSAILTVGHLVLQLMGVL